MSYGEHEKASQNWEGMDGATAWHIIDRHADGWADVGRMMQEWLDANSFKQQRDGHVEEIKLIKQQIDELLSKKFTRFANDECWIYQGDGEDHLESLVCPVVISASQLLQIEKQRDELLAAMELLVAGIENSVSETFIPLVKARAALASVKGGAA